MNKNLQQQLDECDETVDKIAVLREHNTKRILGMMQLGQQAPNTLPIVIDRMIEWLFPDMERRQAFVLEVEERIAELIDEMATENIGLVVPTDFRLS